MNNYKGLEDDVDTIHTKRSNLMSPSSIYIQTDPDKQSLKMQKQDDIARQIDYSNNIIIMIGAGLTLCMLASFQIYLNK